MRWLALILLYLPLAATAETVTIPGPIGPLEAETLAPEGAKHSVVIIPGTGPIDRDGNAPDLGLDSDTYKLLAEALQAEGVASFRIDKRGFHGSARAARDITIAGYAEDARAWVERAAQDVPCVWIAGHSEGGLVALLAAQDPPEALCGLILLAAAGTPVGPVLVEQIRDNPATTSLAGEAARLVAELEAGRTRDPASLSPALRFLFSEGNQRFMTDLFAYDPIPLAKTWAGPTLIVQGDRDLQFRPYHSDLLAAALPQAGRAPLPGATHMLKRDVPGAPFATYRDPTLPLHPDLVPAIVDFLAGRD